MFSKYFKIWHIIFILGFKTSSFLFNSVSDESLTCLFARILFILLELLGMSFV
jgi:hypothetical protein